MGRRTRVKKNTNRNGETSSSSTSTSLRRSQRLLTMGLTGLNHTTDNKVQGGENPNKKMNRDDSSLSSNSSGQVEVQRSGVKEVSLDNLPPEMLMEILKCLDIQSLQKIRLVNRTCCAISSGILSKRSGAVISFLLKASNEFSWSGLLKEECNLGEFVECMKKSQNNPYSHFVFSVYHDSPSSEVYNHFEEFLAVFSGSSQNQNRRIKSLRFELINLNESRKLEFFTAKLGDLLQNKVALVENLVLEFYSSVKAPQLKLFPIPQQQQQKQPEISTLADTEKTVKEIPVPVSAPAQSQFQLAHLKSIHFSTPMISSYTEIVRDLLNAAVNLTRIRMWATSFEDFQFLDSLGKFHLLKEAEVEIDENFFSSIKSCGSLSLPKLEFLHVMMSMRERGETCLTQVSTFLSNLLEVCKDTVKILTVQPVGHLPGLKLPTFKNVRKLRIHQHHNKIGCTFARIFPPGIRSMDIFPAVCDLDLEMIDWPRAFPQEDSIPLLPNVKVLNLKDSEIRPDAIPILALILPNLKKFKVYRDDLYDFLFASDDENDDGPQDDQLDVSPQLKLLQVGREIWTHMPKLEVLEIDVQMVASEHPHLLDSWFTGISEKNCQRLHKMKMMETGKKSAARQSRRGKFKIPETEDELKAMREYSSILDMKGLRKLTLNPYTGEKLMDKQKFFPNNLTWIGQEYAFKLMPHLKPNED